MKLRMPEMPAPILLSALGSYNLLPAIVFLPTRRRCDQAASEAALIRRDPDKTRREARREFMEQLVVTHPEVRRHRHWSLIINGAVASHHAGHIPAWKMGIEKLMSAGLLDAIFATATVAAGVDFPARTVVLTGAESRTGSGWRQFSASELQQMTGRAGRRGRDKVGFVVAAPGLHQDPQKIAELLRAEPDPLISQFRATYSTLLNLLDAFGSFSHIREIAEKSFAHREAISRIRSLSEHRTENEARIKEKLQQASLDIPLSLVQGFERLISARAKLQEFQPQTRAEVIYGWLDREVKAGRIVGIGRSGRRLVLVTDRRDGNVGGIREDGRRASFPLERIGRVYEPVYRAHRDSNEEAFEEVRAKGRELVIPEPRLKFIRAEEAEALDLIDTLIEKITRGDDRVTEMLWGLMPDAEAIERATRRIDALRDDVWQPFAQHARVLAHFGYLNYEAEKVTERGRWLADLHIDRPLLVGEALEGGLFSSLDVQTMAAVMAALTADEDRDYGELELSDAVVTALTEFEEVGLRVSTEEWKYGVEPAPELNFSAAGAAYGWAGGEDWAKLVAETKAEEGDLYRMLSRTGEALLQVAGLRRVHNQAALTAGKAAEIVLREPVR